MHVARGMSLTVSHLGCVLRSDHDEGMSKPLVIWDGRTIPVDEFCSDHWHLFRVVLDVCEHEGFYSPELAPRTSWLGGPTLCRTVEVAGHTDIDVLSDLASAGLIYGIPQNETAVYLPCARGSVVSEWLDRHLLGGGNYANFDPRTETPMPDLIPRGMFRHQSGGVRLFPDLRVKYLSRS